MKVKLSSEEIKEAIAEYIERKFYIDSSCVGFEEAYVENSSISNNPFSNIDSIRDIEIHPIEVPVLPQNKRALEYDSVARLMKHDETSIFPRDSKAWDIN